jgi:hypothetical protein
MPLLGTSRDEPHMSDDRLELYLLKHSLATDERANIEEHLLSCRFCISRLEKLQEFIDLLRAALGAPQFSGPQKVFKKAFQA